MKKQKITAFTIALLTAVSLCGCNNGNQSSDNSSNSIESSNGGSLIQTQSQSTDSNPDKVSDNNSGSPDKTSSDTSTVKEPYEFFGALNDPVDRSEIVKAKKRVLNPESHLREAKDVPLDKLEESEPDNIYAGFAYCALPIYPAVTDRESEYDEESRTFKDIPQQIKSDYIKVRPGDEICGLTVAEASSDFKPGNNGGRSEIRSSRIKLKGSITIEGYIRILTKPEYATGYDGDMIFVPVGDVQLPVVRFDGHYESRASFRDIGDVCIMEDLTFSNEFSVFFDLGNINETTADVSEIPYDGSFVKVKAVISDLEMQTSHEWYTISYAVLESVTRID